MSNPKAAQPPALPRNVPMDQRIYLALPCYGGVLQQGFTAGLLNTLLATDIIDHVEFLCNDSLVSRARNTLVARFLQSRYQWLMFIDTDILFEPLHVARLWLHGIKHGRKIVGGLYAMKKITPHFVANWLPGEKPDENGAVKVREAGTGFLLIHRSVFETMREKMPEIAFTTDANTVDGAGVTQWDFFAVGPYTDQSGLTRYLSEDWMFCQRARDLGMDVWADTQIQLQHHGSMDFPPSPADLVAAVKTVRRMGHPGLPPELV